MTDLTRADRTVNDAKRKALADYLASAGRFLRAMYPCVELPYANDVAMALMRIAAACEDFAEELGADVDEKYKG